MDAKKAKAAIDAIPYPDKPTRTKAERTALIQAHREAISKISQDFRAWLADEYAAELPSEVQDMLWAKAWQDGHPYGYGEVEIHYGDLAQFVSDVLKYMEK